jgi:ornithine cyclodeaminase/alanine dehydrogenase-like protein (mu-crystallin family)
VISGRVQGRTSDRDITVAKLVGIGAQDLAAAEVTLAKL